MQKTFRNLISKYPDSEFATDAIFKIDLINEVGVSKEMLLEDITLIKKMDPGNKQI